MPAPDRQGKGKRWRGNGFVTRSNAVACLQQPLTFLPTRLYEDSESPIIQLRIVAILPEERAMQDPAKRSEHYREKAAKYHELAKRAHPPYLGEFYRGIAVRYVFMARELSQQAEKELGTTRQRVDATTEVSRPATQDLDLLAVWADDKVRHEPH
jgi:hypothetical protein